MKLKSLVALFLFIAVGLSNAQMKEIEFEEYDLDNGMHVILYQDNTTPIVTVSVQYHVGSKNEKADRTGFAHFFEHLMFEGSEYIERGKYFDIVQRNGGTLNAFTSFDQTYYYETLPSNQLELALWLESERMLHLKIDSTGVETQRKVVKEERSQRYDNQPYGSWQEEMFKRAFTKHPYNWTPIGSAQYIDEAKISEFMDFYKMYYNPNNAVLTVAGDIDKAESKKMIEEYFGDIKNNDVEIVRPDVVEPAKTEEVRHVVYDNIQLPGVIMGYSIPAQGTDDYYALSMLNTLLATGQSSRMYKELVDNSQTAVSAGSFPIALEDPGLIVIFGIANMGVEIDNLEAAIQKEIDKVKNEMISDKEFEKLRNQTESSYVSNFFSVSGIAQNLAQYHTFFGDANLINTEIERYMDVTKEDIQRVAQEYLKDTNRVVLHYLPKSAEAN
ncbi:MAG: insulinase family protein [Melioribacteraceae bacterium]|nr:insulinase family protein [Melioribacteraceae bacterium]MCF8263447.1 insulinase family protein [Melioribacteraceae bacterium]MCF8414037.1 insulinase family protein [Melioribacteraceae bacterium]MCF8431008.1 insulinase family protein [Melioribacteraceae bacterium]